MRYVRKIIVTVLAVSLVLSLGEALAKALPKTAKLVPANTIILVDIDNFSQAQSQFEKTNFYKLYKDPVMAAFVENVRTQLRAKVGKLDGNNILRTFFDAGIWPEGKAAAAFLPNGRTKDVNESEVLFLSQWGSNIGKIKEAIGKMLEKNAELGGRKKTAEDYRGVKIETLVDEKSAAMTYCFIDDCFLASSDVEVLKFVIAHIQGLSSPSLADDTDYSEGLAATGPYHDIDIYVNIKQILKIASADSSGDNRSMFNSFGIDNVTGLNCSLAVARRPASSCGGKIFLKINGAKKGICKMLEVEAGPLRVPRFIPTSAYSVMVLNLNVKKAYDELCNMLVGIDPASATEIAGPIAGTGSEGRQPLQVKSDIIDHLGSQVVITQCINKPFSKDSSPEETLMAVAINNRTALEKSLAILHSKFIAEGNPDAKRELLGHTIYLMAGPNMFMPFTPGGKTSMAQGPLRENVPQKPKFAFTVTDTYLILGREDMVEGAIRTLRSQGASSIESTKWFTGAKSALPSVLGIASMEDSAAATELIWWMIKENAKSRTSEGISPNPEMMLAKGASGMVDFNLLPPFDAVRKYFNQFAMYGLSRPDGFFVEFNYFSPPIAE